MSRRTPGTSARQISARREGRRILPPMKGTLTTAAAAMLLLAGSPAWAGPTDQLREYTDQVIKVLDDPALARQDRKSTRLNSSH